MNIKIVYRVINNKISEVNSISFWNKDNVSFTIVLDTSQVNFWSELDIM